MNVDKVSQELRSLNEDVEQMIELIGFALIFMVLLCLLLRALYYRFIARLRPGFSERIPSHLTRALRKRTDPRRAAFYPRQR
jgi:hypothetical protein